MLFSKLYQKSQANPNPNPIAILRRGDVDCNNPTFDIKVYFSRLVEKE